MRICTLLFFFISALTCHSLCAHNPAGHYFLTQDSTSSLTSSALPAKPKKTKELFQQNFSYMGIPFIVSGLIVKKQNQDFRTLRNRFQPTFHHEYDNYTQYVPLVQFCLISLFRESQIQKKRKFLLFKSPRIHLQLICIFHS